MADDREDIQALNALERALSDCDPLNRANAAAEIFGGLGVPPGDEEARRIIALRIAAPKRADAGKLIEQQQDAAHLPLFVHANEPKFI